jgi:tRNA G37 N-methylase Trm5
MQAAKGEANMLTDLKGRLRLVLRNWKGHALRRLLGKRAFSLLVRTEHGVFAVDPEDTAGVGGVLLRRGAYGAAELQRLQTLVRPADTVLIVGAHIGALAIPLAKRCTRVLAVEANPFTFELLRYNLALNRCDNCTAYNVAANHEPCCLHCLANRTNSGGSKRVPKKQVLPLLL